MVKFNLGRSRHAHLKNILISCLLPWLVSCSSLVKDPKIHLERIDVRESDFKGAKLFFILDVENPNNFDIKVDEVKYKVFLGEKFFAEAKTSEAVKVGASSKTSVELPLPVEYSKLLGGLASLISGKTLTYKVQGEAKLSFLGLSIPFTEGGSFNLGLSGLKEVKEVKEVKEKRD